MLEKYVPWAEEEPSLRPLNPVLPAISAEPGYLAREVDELLRKINEHLIDNARSHRKAYDLANGALVRP